MLYNSASSTNKSSGKQCKNRLIWILTNKLEIDRYLSFNGKLVSIKCGSPVTFKWFKSTGKIISKAISGVRGTNYTVKQSVGLYPTSATSDDYCYSRHIIDTSKGKVMSYTFETGKEFQPHIKEGTNIISEVSAGLLAFCISIGSVTRSVTNSSEIISKNKFRKKNRIITTGR